MNANERESFIFISVYSRFKNLPDDSTRRSQFRSSGDTRFLGAKT